METKRACGHRKFVHFWRGAVDDAYTCFTFVRPSRSSSFVRVVGPSSTRRGGNFSVNTATAATLVRCTGVVQRHRACGNNGRLKAPPLTRCFFTTATTFKNNNESIFNEFYEKESQDDVETGCGDVNGDCVSHSFWSVAQSKFIDIRERNTLSKFQSTRSDDTALPSGAIAAAAPSMVGAPCPTLTSPSPPLHSTPPPSSSTAFAEDVASPPPSRISPPNTSPKDWDLLSVEVLEPKSYPAHWGKMDDEDANAVQRDLFSGPTTITTPSTSTHTRTGMNNATELLRDRRGESQQEMRRRTTTMEEYEDATRGAAAAPLSHPPSSPMKGSRAPPPPRKAMVMTITREEEGRTTTSTSMTSSATEKEELLYPGREGLPPLAPTKPVSKFSFLAHYSHASSERNYNINSEVPNSVPKPKLPMWASSLTHPALEKERLCKENWISQDAAGFLSPRGREALEAWLTQWLQTTSSSMGMTTTNAGGTNSSTRVAVPKVDVVNMLKENLYIHPRKASFRGVFAKKSFKAGEVMMAIPIAVVSVAGTSLDEQSKGGRETEKQESSNRRSWTTTTSRGAVEDKEVKESSVLGKVKKGILMAAERIRLWRGGECSSAGAPDTSAHSLRSNASLGRENTTFMGILSPTTQRHAAMHTESLQACAPIPTSSSSSVGSALPPFSLVMEYVLSLKRSSLDPTPHILFIEQVYLAMQFGIILESFGELVKKRTFEEEDDYAEKSTKVKENKEASPNASSPCSPIGDDARTPTSKRKYDDLSCFSSSVESFWGPYLYLLRYGEPPPSPRASTGRPTTSVDSPSEGSPGGLTTPASSSSSARSIPPSSAAAGGNVSTTPPLSCPPPSPLPLFDDDRIKERHKWVLEPQTFLEYSDLCLRFRHLLRGLHARWWRYYNDVILRQTFYTSHLSHPPPDVVPGAPPAPRHRPTPPPPPPSLETLEWAFRVVLSRQRSLPQQRAQLAALQANVQKALSADDNEAQDWFGRMVMNVKWRAYENVLNVVDKRRLCSNDVSDPTAMPAVLPLLDLLQHASSGKANTAMTFETGLEGSGAASSSMEVLYAVVRAAEAIEEDEELTTLYPKCYSVAYTLYRYGSLALRKRGEDVEHLMDA